MDAVVDHTRGKGRLHSIRTSLLGEGLLERARATTLGLLGGAAAVGLAMLALVLNQGWPLIAGAPVPPLPPREQAVAKAKVVAASGHRQADSSAGAPPTQEPRGDRSEAEPGPAAGNGSTQGPSSELVVVPAAPVDQQADAPPNGDHQSPAPATPTVSPAPQAPTPAEDAEQPPPSTPVVASVPEQAPPPAGVSEAPESSVPPWSNGRGHAYGRSEAPQPASTEDDPEDDCHGHGYDDSHGQGHGYDDDSHGHGYGRDDD